MNLRIIAMLMTLSFGTWLTLTAGATKETSMNTAPGRARAEAKVAVQSSQATSYDQSAKPALLEINLSETFTGEMAGQSMARALEVRQENGSSDLVSMQRFSGKLGNRQGTFVLQGSETVENGHIRATWFVVAGSGTGDLAGLRGDGGFEGEFGKGSDGWLEYWFE